MTRLSVRSVVLAMIAAASLTGVARAQGVSTPEPGDFTFAIKGGLELNPSWTFTSNASTSSNGSLVAEDQDWGDIYTRFLAVEAEVAYGLSSNDEVAITLTYTSANGGTRTIGTRGGQVPFALTVSDYNGVALAATYRRYINLTPGLAPFIGFTGGFRRQDAVDATLFAPGFPTAGGSVAPLSVSGELFAQDWVPMIGITFGWRNMFRGVKLGLETGVSYEFSPDDTATLASSLGLDGITEEGDRLYIPLKFTIAY